ATVAPIGDPEVRAAARRLLGRARRSGRGVTALGLLLAGALATGCASTTASDGSARRTAAEPSRVGPSQDAAAEADYHYSTAQYQAQAGRLKEAVDAMQAALKRDPDSPVLWRELAQWLARADNPDQALTAARRAVELAPSEPGAHMALAEMLRAQKK